MNPILLRLWKNSLLEISPAHILPAVSSEAILYWGKAAHESFHVRAPQSGRPFYVVEGEHPIPGEKSFQAGAEILDFFDALRRMRLKKLRIFLSGGASSMAWLKPASVSHEQLLKHLAQAYSQALTIRELNRIRSRYCELKSGGAARWLKKIAPDVRVHVDVISDVLPFGPEIVGSGPFWDGNITHSVVMDNTGWVRRIRKLAQIEGVSILSFSSGNLGSVQIWSKAISSLIKENLNKNGLIVFGGEPQLRLPKKCGRGGRQSHLAALLLDQWWDEIESGKVEILCASSDGVDGSSGGAGVRLSARGLKNGLKVQLQHAVRTYNTGSYFAQKGMLLSHLNSGTNVQDVVFVMIK